MKKIEHTEYAVKRSRYAKSMLMIVLMLMMSLMFSFTALGATAVTGLTATAYDGQVNLSWSASIDGQYNVYRSPDNITFTKISGVTPLTVTSYADTTVVNGTLYYYHVKSFDGAVESAASNVVQATPVVGGALFTSLTTANITTNATTWASNFDNVLLVVVGIGVAFSCVRFVKGLFF